MKKNILLALVAVTAIAGSMQAACKNGQCGKTTVKVQPKRR